MADGRTPEELKQIGASTRFGQPNGADPKAAREKQINPSSIRTGIRRLMAREIDATNPEDIKAQMTPEARLKYLAGPQGKVTEAMIMAMTAVTQAGQNFKAMANMIDQVDGKLVEKKVEATIPFADIVKESLQDDIDQRSEIKD